MKLNNFAIILALTLILTPIVAFSGTTPEKTTVLSQDYGDSVGAQVGMTIKYDINALTLPPYPNVTLGDLAGNQLYVKVMAVETNHEFEPSVTGNLIWYNIGLLFKQDYQFTIGEGFMAMHIIIPTGSATPAIGEAGVPHFNGTSYGPAIFFLDNGWLEHALFLESFGFTVTSSTSALEATYTTDVSEVSLAWRKSDGLLTRFIIDNTNFMGLDYTGRILDITFASVEVIALDINIGDVIELDAKIAYLNIEVSGEYYSFIEQTAISEIESSVASMKDQLVLKYEITNIEGLFYTADVYYYNLDTQSLFPSANNYLFSGFLGTLQNAYPPPLYDYYNSYFIGVYTPVLTADYEIYTGYMILADTIFGIYLDDIIPYFNDINDLFPLDRIVGDFSIIEKRGYFYMKENIDFSMKNQIQMALEQMVIQADLSQVDISVTQEGWIAYSMDNGNLAGMRTQIIIDIDISLSYLTITGAPVGSITITFDMKLINPNYNPPDPMKGGIIPGFTWLISIPTILVIATIGLIHRRK